MNERLKMLRKHFEMNQEDFGKILGITKSGVSDIESGRRKVTEQHIFMLKSQKNVNEEWLRTGEGDMFVQQSIDDKIASFIGGIQMTEDDSFKRRLISVLANLKEEQWEVLAEIAENLTTEKG